MPTQTIRLDSNVMNMLHARAASQRQSVEEYTNNLLRVVLDVQLVAPAAYREQENPEVMTPLPYNVIACALQAAERSVTVGDYVSNDVIEDIVAKELGWN